MIIRGSLFVNLTAPSRFRSLTGVEGDACDEELPFVEVSDEFAGLRRQPVDLFLSPSCQDVGAAPGPRLQLVLGSTGRPAPFVHLDVSAPEAHRRLRDVQFGRDLVVGPTVSAQLAGAGSARSPCRGSPWRQVSRPGVTAKGAMCAFDSVSSLGLRSATTSARGRGGAGTSRWSGGCRRPARATMAEAAAEKAKAVIDLTVERARDLLPADRRPRSE